MMLGDFKNEERKYLLYENVIDIGEPNLAPKGSHTFEVTLMISKNGILTMTTKNQDGETTYNEVG